MGAAATSEGKSARVYVAPNARVGPVGREDGDDRLDVVLGHADRIPGEQLLDLHDVLHLRVLHVPLLSREPLGVEKPAFSER